MKHSIFLHVLTNFKCVFFLYFIEEIIKKIFKKNILACTVQFLFSNSHCQYCIQVFRISIWNDFELKSLGLNIKIVLNNFNLVFNKTFPIIKTKMLLCMRKSRNPKMIYNKKRVFLCFSLHTVCTNRNFILDQ